MLAELREHLSETPSRRAFEKVVNCLLSSNDVGEVSVGLDYAEQHMAGWSEEERFYNDPPRALFFGPNRVVSKLLCGFSVHAQPWDDLDVSALANNPYLERLSTLSLCHNQITATGIQDLVSASWYGNLRNLDLSHNPLGDRGVQLMTVERSSLEQLNLMSVELTDAGVNALAHSATPYANLRTLRLTGNSFTSVGVLHLANSPHMTSLKTLELGVINREAMRFILSSAFLSEYVKLYFRKYVSTGWMPSSSVAVISDTVEGIHSPFNQHYIRRVPDE